MLASALGALGPEAAPASELEACGGVVRSDRAGDRSYTWAIEYREPLSDHLAAGFVWLNEGHIPRNDRDGQALQLWAHTSPTDHGLFFDAGVGPHLAYDTQFIDPEPYYENRHRVGALVSASANWMFASRWYAFLRTTRTEFVDHSDTASLSLGVGYQFSLGMVLQQDGDTGAAHGGSRRWEVTGRAGERIANTTHSEVGQAQEFDLRRQIGDAITASVSVIAGRGTPVNGRLGYIGELWYELPLARRLSAGIDAGAFVVSEDYSLSDPAAYDNLAAVVSVTAIYHLADRWVLRAIWHRVGTGDDRDCDIVIAGAATGSSLRGGRPGPSSPPYCPGSAGTHFPSRCIAVTVISILPSPRMIRSTTGNTLRASGSSIQPAYLMW